MVSTQASTTRRRSADQDGFTLVEAVLVVAILGILSGIAVLAVGTLTGSHSQSACQAVFRSVQAAIEAYKSQMGGYPNATAANGGNGALPATDSDPSTRNAAAARTGTGSELLVQGNTSPNTVASATGSGPWLKDVPVSPGHYSISVANDGTGTISVYNNLNQLQGTSASNCPTT
jgi:prepilin-type N-terminal cleavage/methylation domain-containing protein